MSVRHRPLRSAKRSTPAAASPAPFQLPEPAPLPEPAEPAGSDVATGQGSAAEQQASQVLELLNQAGRLAQRLLSRMECRLERGEEVYPREFVHVCRGLQVLAKCNTELLRQTALGRQHAVPDKLRRLEEQLQPFMADWERRAKAA